MLLAIILRGLASFDSAAAQPAPARDDAAATTASLDGLYLALGPVAAAVYAADDEVWDGGFGGELMVVRVRERAWLGAYGLAVGGERFVEAGNGRLWGDFLVATKRLLGVAVGVSAGLAVEVGDLQAPRFGWQTTIWSFAGVIPYVRVGSVEKSGTFVDAGLKIALPALRW